MAAIISINSGTGGVSDDNITLGSTVSLYSVDAATTYQWAIVSEPAGAPVSLLTPTQRGASFVASKEGSYLLLLTVDDGLPTESSQQLIAAVRELETGDRVPAIGETVENSANDGWANPVDAILRRVTQFTEAGVLPGVAAESMVVGNVVYAGDVYTLAAGLPGERVVASWSKAHADVAAEVQGVFGVVAGSVDGGSIAANDVITVQTTGLYQGVPFGSAPSVGDPVYISDTAGLALTPGTIKRQIGTVCAVGASTFDVMVGPAPVELATATLYAKTYWVSTAGSDVAGDGSIINPFATPQKAHDVALVDYPTDWVSVEIGPGEFTGNLDVTKWNIVFHGAGSRPETEATQIRGTVTVEPDGATQKFNQAIGLDQLFVQAAGAGAPALYVTGTGLFSLLVSNCYLTTGDALATASVFIEPPNAGRPRISLSNCIVTAQVAGPNLVLIDKGDVRIENTQLYFGSTVSSGSVGKGITVANNASLVADRLLLDIQTIGPGIEVTGSYAGAKLTLSGSSVTLSYASCSHGISVTNGSAGQVAAFVWNTLFGVTNLTSKAIFGSGSVGTNIVTGAQLSYIYGTSSAIGSAVTLLGMTGDVAGGDLSGNLPSPTVAKLQGRAVSATAPASGEVLGWNGSAWAPTSNSAPPTGTAGGVLGYNGSSTYPNPNGLAPTLGSSIPVQGTIGAVTSFDVDSVTSTLKAPGLAINAAQNGGSGAGGDAKLVGGTVSIGAGGNAYSYGGDGGTAGGSAQINGGGSADANGSRVIADGAVGTTGGMVTVLGGAGDDGGAIEVTAGQANAGTGGNVTISGGAASGAGGNATLQAGNGVVGGAILIVSGDGSGGSAGSLDIRGGSGTGGAGGPSMMQGGSSVSHGGGLASVVGGEASASGATSGGATVDAGAATGSATAGAVSLGRTNAASVAIGRSGQDVKTYGRNVEMTDSRAAVAATTLPVNAPTILLTNAGAIDLNGGNPEVQTSSITTGTRVTIIQTGAGTTTFRDSSDDATSALELSAASHVLGQYDALTLVFTGTVWVEVAFVNN